MPIGVKHQIRTAALLFSQPAKAFLMGHRNTSTKKKIPLNVKRKKKVPKSQKMSKFDNVYIVTHVTKWIF